MIFKYSIELLGTKARTISENICVLSSGHDVTCHAQLAFTSTKKYSDYSQCWQQRNWLLHCNISHAQTDIRASHLSLDRSEIKTVILVDNYNPKYSPRIYAFRVSTA